MDHVECIVAGAGVVGLAVARELARAGLEVVVLESADRIGSGISSRNSEVVHAGLYYPPGSLKAKTCVEGSRALYGFCERYGVRHEKCGKLIVATSPDELDTLEQIAERSAANEVEGMRPLSREEARRLEPALACTAALLSGETGIVDAHGYMLALQGDAEAADCVFAFNAPVDRLSFDGKVFALTTSGPQPFALSCRRFVNCAGLDAPALAARIEGLDRAYVPKAYFAKGSYFSLRGAAPFRRLIYPVPVPGGLGVHLTLDLSHRIRFGPDVEWVDAPNYDFDAGRARLFHAAIRRYWPDLPDDALEPAYCGIRPKLAPAGAPPRDFLIEGPGQHGLPGLVNLFGIESPGLTASLALGTIVRTMICG